MKIMRRKILTINVDSDEDFKTGKYRHYKTDIDSNDDIKKHLKECTDFILKHPAHNDFLKEIQKRLCDKLLSDEAMKELLTFGDYDHDYGNWEFDISLDEVDFIMIDGKKYILEEIDN